MILKATLVSNVQVGSSGACNLEYDDVVIVGFVQTNGHDVNAVYIGPDGELYYRMLRCFRDVTVVPEQ